MARLGGSGERTQEEVRLDIAEFLNRQHFVVEVSDAVEGQPTIRATAGDCRMLVVESPAAGWNSNMLQLYTTAADRSFVVYRGRVYANQPTWLTVSDAVWFRVRRELGLKVRTMPILAIIATASCDTERLPWNELD